MDAQRSLFDLPPPPRPEDLGPDATHEERAWAFRHAEPAVFGEFARRARRAAEAGLEHYSHRAIWEAMRYHYDFEHVDPGPKLNNNHLPFFARWAMDERHVPPGFFHTRAR